MYHVHLFVRNENYDLEATLKYIFILSLVLSQKNSMILITNLCQKVFYFEIKLVCITSIVWINKIYFVDLVSIKAW